MSPRELFREFAAENARRRDAANRDARRAWLIVDMWASTKVKKRVPKLEDYLVTERPRGTKLQALRGQLAMLSEKYGIPLRKAKGKKQ